jgi:hypothetical protein
MLIETDAKSANPVDLGAKVMRKKIFDLHGT